MRHAAMAFLTVCGAMGAAAPARAQDLRITEPRFRLPADAVARPPLPQTIWDANYTLDVQSVGAEMTINASTVRVPLTLIGGSMVTLDFYAPSFGNAIPRPMSVAGSDLMRTTLRGFEQFRNRQTAPITSLALRIENVWRGANSTTAYYSKQIMKVTLSNSAPEIWGSDTAFRGTLSSLQIVDTGTFTEGTHPAFGAYAVVTLFRSDGSLRKGYLLRTAVTVMDNNAQVALSPLAPTEARSFLNSMFANDPPAIVVLGATKLDGIAATYVVAQGPNTGWY